MVGPSSILTARKASLGEWRARTESHDLNGRLSLWRCGGWGGMSQLLERVSHAGRPHDPPVRPTSWTAGGEPGSGSGSQAEPRVLVGRSQLTCLWAGQRGLALEEMSSEWTTAPPPAWALLGSESTPSPVGPTEAAEGDPEPVPHAIPP